MHIPTIMPWFANFQNNKVGFFGPTFALVVAEQIGEGYKTRGVFTDANLCTEFGYYYNTGKANNMPSDLQEEFYLTMVVLKTLFGLIQFCIGNTKATLHVRARTNTGLWTTWKSLA